MALSNQIFISSLLLMQYTSTAFHASIPNLSLMKKSPSTIRNNDFVIFAISSEEAIERMRQQKEQEKAIMEQELPPMLFDEEMLSEMQAALLTLEKRVQEGPGSLTRLEVDQLGARLNMIIDEMIVNEDKRPAKPQRSETQQQQPNVQSSYIPAPTKPMIDNSNEDGPGYNTNEDGPAYDGTGGMGQPRGTVNTYAIDGMEDMSSEEYMKALTDNVINTQNERRRNGTIGNGNTWSYLSSLTGKPEGILKRKNGIESNTEDEY